MELTAREIARKSSPDYQRGYRDGFIEGRDQLWENVKDLILNQKPSPILIDAKDIDPELLKQWLEKAVNQGNSQ
jgi:hypothetical protein